MNTYEVNCYASGLTIPCKIKLGARGEFISFDIDWNSPIILNNNDEGVPAKLLKADHFMKNDFARNSKGEVPYLATKFCISLLRATPENHIEHGMMNMIYVRQLQILGMGLAA